MNRNPEAVTISVQWPDDFDAFWAAGLAEIASHPLDATVTLLPHRSTSRVQVFDVSYTSYQGLRVSAWYATPQGAGPFPALVTIPGYISEPVIPRTSTWSAPSTYSSIAQRSTRSASGSKVTAKAAVLG